ncbi:hypothetical protein CAS74_003214 [Pichia kudriavzevii]|uniref:Uncharacterized protein n=1 Tax=Pichia kudriavzevii TaxID=4909 RepID=A0A1Z8JP59_PICKU|nr:hypothetical protein CAS74_003214 [Pichia kudriavzevii]
MATSKVITATMTTPTDNGRPLFKLPFEESLDKISPPKTLFVILQPRPPIMETRATTLTKCGPKRYLEEHIWRTNELSEDTVQQCITISSPKSRGPKKKEDIDVRPAHPAIHTPSVEM